MHLIFNNIPKGYTFRYPENQHKATEKIVSDGKVDDAFASQDEAFINDIKDPRVQAYVQNDSASPGEGWVPHELGGFDYKNQSLYKEKGHVVLRTKIQEDGTEIQHKVFGAVEPDYSKFPESASKMTHVSEGYMIEDKQWTADQAKAKAEGAILLPTSLRATTVDHFYKEWLTPNS